MATFSKAVSGLRVFPSIDHFGSAYDGYQYSIEGGNDGTTWTPLFDAQTVTGSGEPFTLGTFTRTAPFRVNNVLTPGGPGPGAASDALGVGDSAPKAQHVHHVIKPRRFAGQPLRRRQRPAREQAPVPGRM